MADSTIEIQGFRVLVHDNEDGTYSFYATTTVGGIVVTIEEQGMRMQLTQAGTMMIGGVSTPVYVPVVNISDVPTSLNFSDGEIPAGVVDGHNRVFTLAYSPNPADSLQLVENGLLQQQGTGNDYTLSGAAITFADAPLADSLLLVWYRH